MQLPVINQQPQLSVQLFHESDPETGSVGAYEHGAYNTTVIGSISLWPIYLIAGFDDTCGSLSTQNIL